MSQPFLPDPPASPLPAGRAFVRHARYRLREDYFVKIATVVAELTDEQVWWRPNDASNSIGNLVLHVCGNARQWIVAGVGGAADVRDRPQEFAARPHLGAYRGTAAHFEPRFNGPSSYSRTRSPACHFASRTIWPV